MNSHEDLALKIQQSSNRLFRAIMLAGDFGGL
jgi:hypothetical protein